MHLVVEFLLEKYGVSTAEYKYKNRYGTVKGLSKYINENKSALQKVSRSAKSIAKAIRIIVVITQICKFMSTKINNYKSIASQIFDALIEIIKAIGAKLAGWITSLLLPAKVLVKKAAEFIFGIIFDLIFDLKWVSNLEKHYLKYITSSKLSFTDYLKALFKGIKSYAFS